MDEHPARGALLGMRKIMHRPLVGIYWKFSLVGFGCPTGQS